MPEFANLLVVEEGKPNREIALGEGAHLLGSDAACDVVIESEFIAPRQMRLKVCEDHFEVESLGSNSGTLVIGGESLIERESKFAYPDSIELGPLSIQVRRAGDEVGRGVVFPEQRYEIGAEIARGGMGVVLEADESALERKVAMKMIHAEGGSQAAGSSQRFLREARVLGLLEHPNIVPVYELGKTPEGGLFYTMKKVEGSTLQEVLRGVRDRDPAFAEFTLHHLLSIFLKVGDAIAFAHSKGVIHRDLKPDNIMIGEFGEVLVMDWGLAKLLGEESLGTDAVETWQAPDLTMQGTVMGSPNYMSPEQARGRSAEIDERSDVYGLGGLLYAILTLRPPVTGETVNEVLDSVRSGSITPPAETGLSGEHLARVPAALSAVAVRALARDKADRYPTAAALNSEISAHLGGYATTAEQAGAWKRLKLFLKRHRAVSIASAAALALLVVLAVGGPLAAIRQAQLAEDARSAEATAEARAEDLREQLYAFEMIAATREAYRPGGDPQIDQWKPEPGEPDLRGWEWYAASSVLDRAVARYPSGHDWPKFDWTPDSGGLVLFDSNKAVTAWSPADNRVLHQWHLPEWMESLEMRDDGSLMLFTNSQFRMVSREDGNEQIAGSVGEAEHGLSISPDGRTIAWVRGTAGSKFASEVWLWNSHEDPETARRVPIKGRPYAPAMTWHPDSSRLATGGSPFGIMYLIDVARGELLAKRNVPGGMRALKTLTWSPGGGRIAAATNDGAIFIVDAENLEASPGWGPVDGRLAPTHALAWSPDGKRLASGGDDRVLHVWETTSAKKQHVYGGLDGIVRDLGWSPDGKWIAAGAQGGTISVWGSEGSPASAEIPLATPLQVNIVEWHPTDDRVILSANDSHSWRCHILDLPSRKLIQHPGAWARSASWDPSGRRLAYDLLDGGTDTLCLMDGTGGEVSKTQVGPSYAHCWNPTGDKVACRNHKGKVWILDVASGTVDIEFEIADGQATSKPSRQIAWSPGGDLLAFGRGDGVISLWGAKTGKLVRLLEGHETRVRGIDWNRDGTLLASASEDQTVRIWDVATGHTLKTLTGHSGGVFDVRWSPDDNRLASASLDAAVRVWDPESGYQLGHFPSSGPMRSVDWSPDGQQLIAGGDSGLQLWDSRPGESARDVDNGEAPLPGRALGRGGLSFRKAPPRNLAGRLVESR